MDPQCSPVLTHIPLHLFFTLLDMWNLTGQTDQAGQTGSRLASCPICIMYLQWGRDTLQLVWLGERGSWSPKPLSPYSASWSIPISAQRLWCVGNMSSQD